MGQLQEATGGPCGGPDSGPPVFTHGQVTHILGWKGPPLEHHPIPHPLFNPPVMRKSPKNIGLPKTYLGTGRMLGRSKARAPSRSLRDHETLESLLDLKIIARRPFRQRQPRECAPPLLQ